MNFLSFNIFLIAAKINAINFVNSHRYADESNLDYFPSIYSFGMCKIECKINMMQQLCGCVPFFYKKRANDQYCNGLDLRCIDVNNGKGF